MDLGKPDAKLMGSGAHVPWSDVWLGIGTDVEARAWAFIPRHDSDEGGFASLAIALPLNSAAVMIGNERIRVANGALPSTYRNEAL